MKRACIALNIDSYGSNYTPILVSEAVTLNTCEFHPIFLEKLKLLTDEN